MRIGKVRLVVLCGTLLLAWSIVLGMPGAGWGRSISVSVGHRNVAVTPILDPSRSSTVTLGAGGGTLSTSTGGGTTVQLTLPRGALAGDEQVTMTPLTRLIGGGVKFVGGVQLDPAGLRLLKPALLTVEPAHPVARPRQVGFGYQGTGGQFGLVPLALKSTIEIPVLQFGGYGLASASSGQRAGRVAHPSSEPQSAWLDQLAGPLYELRSGHAVGTSRLTVSGLIGAYFKTYVKPMLRRSGSSLPAFEHAAARGLGWQREVKLLGYSRSFAGDARALRNAVFIKALRKRWNLIVGACNSAGQTLSRLEAALSLAHIAQSTRTGSRIGGRAGMAAGIQSCGALKLQAALNLTQAKWQSGVSSDRIGQINTELTIPSTPMVLQQVLGTNTFSFASPHAAVTERLTSWTLAPTYSGRGCSQPSFLGFSSDPNQMYGAFNATVTVPADLFDAATPPPTDVALTIFGSDSANWVMTCPPAQTTFFSQAPGAMVGLGAITSFTPVHVPVSATNTTAKFSGSSNILSGSKITAFANGNGSVTITLP